MSIVEEKQTVLVVDDRPGNIDVLSNVLRPLYKVKAAVNGERALKIAADDPRPDIILLDIMMPGMDGYEVCRRLKADDTIKDIPVIFITAKIETDDEVKGFEVGGADYITKPTSPPVVLARVKAHLALMREKKLLLEIMQLRADVERITRHDLKTPLNAIISYPQLIGKDNLTEKQIDQLSKISASAHKLLNMINLSLDLYKMEQGTYQFNPTPVDILPVLDDIAQDNRFFIKSKRIDLEVTVNGVSSSDVKSFEVPGEKLLYYSMLANLIKNALEASPRKEKVAIQLSDNEAFEIAIHNQGAVPIEIRETFFDKYATSGKMSGTGLGTYSAKLIAETQGGSVSMQTSGQAGTTITVSFPKG